MRGVPRGWIERLAGSIPRALLRSDDLQEEIGRGLGILSAITFGLSETSQRAVASIVEEGLEEVGARAGQFPEGAERRQYVRSVMAGIEEKVKKKLKEGESGKNFSDTLASLPPESQQEFWRWFAYLTEDEQSAIRREGAAIVATSDRVAMIIAMPDTLRMDELLSYFQTAPKLAGPEKSLTNRLLGRLGATGAEVDKRLDGLTEDIKSSREKTRRKLDLLKFS